ncbi:MAG TPA: transglutaminase-like domain-containing protein [Terriglobales bacterium]|nr:transglutaminase-like domain-containing protein [Terriglobales bacterium]
MLRHAFVVFALVLFAVGSFAQSGTPERHFRFHYAFTVRNTHVGEPIRIWFPLAHSGEFQAVKIVSQTGDLPLRRARESEYRNAMLYAEDLRGAKAEYNFAVVYDVVRRQSTAYRESLSAEQLRLALSADRLVPITGLPASIAARQVEGIRKEPARARALYNYALANMRYDHVGTGWGHGDTLYACSAKHGNCTDFHSLFISMARSQNIPARFEIGFSIPAEARSGEVAGYHCWAEFQNENHEWVPVDISEAWKHPQQREFFFGHWDDDRVQFTVGRDLTLSPRQAGPPLNYFVYPYVELGGKDYANVSLHFSFEDLGDGATKRGGDLRSTMR